MQAAVAGAEPSVSFPRLLEGDAAAVAAFKASFVTHGWCMLFDVSQSYAQLGDELESFFRSATKGVKRSASRPDGQGYSKVKGVGKDATEDGHTFKEKLSYITGTHPRSSTAGTTPLPTPSLLDGIARLEADARTLCTVIAGPVFSCDTVTELGAAANVPFLQDDRSQAFALFDVAYYLNRHTTGVPPLNCVSHYDPGLFALSLFSNMGGLQVQNQVTKEFVDVPFGPGRGIVWSGDAAHRANKGAIARGIHRVRYPDNVGPQGKARLTFWIELAVPHQLAAYTGASDGAAVAAGDGTPYTNVFPELDTAVTLEATLAARQPPAAGKLVPLESIMGVPMSKMPPKAARTKPLAAPQPASPANHAAESTSVGEKIMSFFLRSPSPTKRNANNVEAWHGVPNTKSLRADPVDEDGTPPVKRSPSPKQSYERISAVPASKARSRSPSPARSIERRAGMPMSKSMYWPTVPSPSSEPKLK